MNANETATLPQVTAIPVYNEGGKTPPFCILDEKRGASMVLSSPEGMLNSCFLARHKLKAGQVRGRSYVDTKLKNGTKFIFLVEGTAQLLLSTKIENKEVLSVRTLEMNAPSVYAVPTGEACVLIPLTDGEIIEFVGTPHKTLVENTVAVDSGEHLTEALKKFGPPPTPSLKEGNNAGLRPATLEAEPKGGASKSRRDESKSSPTFQGGAHTGFGQTKNHAPQN
jgi:hypothetical protein